MSHAKAIHEKRMLEQIYVNVSNNTDIGQKIKNSFDGIICNIIMNGGNRNNHFDFIIFCDNEIKYKVEFKGSNKKTKIDNSKPPWINGVQFYNGTGSIFSIGHKYCQVFYNSMLNNIIQNYSFINQKPPYDIWIKDVFKQGKPTTLFVNELRDKGYKSSYLSQCRKEFNKTFILTEDDLEILKNEVFVIAKKVLEEKDYWLQIHGSLDTVDGFNVQWTPKFVLENIISVKQIFNKSGCDINVEFICNNGFIFYAKLRWGYGQCISNLRVDIK